jgi:hypothetical protein
MSFEFNGWIRQPSTLRGLGVNGLSAPLHQDGVPCTGSNYAGTTQIERHLTLDTAIKAGTFVGDVSSGIGLTFDALAPGRNRCQTVHR